jgi:hypothetical protein
MLKIKKLIIASMTCLSLSDGEYTIFMALKFDLGDELRKKILNLVLIYITKIISFFEFSIELHNMLLSLIPNNYDILIKILLLNWNWCSEEDIEFLFNNYNYLLNIELIQNKFLLNDDISEEIKKQLIKQVIKEDYRISLFIPDYLLTDDIIKLAIKCNPSAIDYISNYKLTDKIIKFAIRIDSDIFKYLPEWKKTDKIIKFAIQRDYELIEYVEKDKITDEIIKLAINKITDFDFNLFLHIRLLEDKITDEIIKLAIKKDKFIIDFYYIPAAKITDEIVELAKMYDYFQEY